MIFIAATALPLILCMALLPIERAFPRRPASVAGPPSRGEVNVLLAASGSLLILILGPWLGRCILEIVVPFSPLSVDRLDTSVWLKGAIGFLILDFSAFVVHVLSHKITLLWRLHQIHHSDGDFDASTGLRHQPLEGLITFAVLTAVLGFAGIPYVVIALYGLVAAAHSVLSHANIALPAELDRYLSLVFVTPDTHRIHHSADPQEHSSNYGQLFTFWDRILGTLRRRRTDEQASIPLGLGADLAGASVLRLLIEPFRPRIRS